MADSLIARLEAATGPSRELDDAIMYALGAMAVPHVEVDGPEWEEVYESLPYTASLDAVMGLMPEGYGAISASINERGPSSMRIGHPYVFGNAATPALALLIAILKARGIE